MNGLRVFFPCNGRNTPGVFRALNWDRFDFISESQHIIIMPGVIPAEESVLYACDSAFWSKGIKC